MIDVVRSHWLEEALAEHASSGKRLGEVLVKRGLVSGPDLTQTLMEQLGVELKKEEGFGSGLWAAIKDSDWALVSPIDFVSRWPMRLWAFDKPYQFIGGSGGAGVGYGAPAAVGAALAHRKHGRLAVSIQADGDLMYAPGVLWTAAHHKIPLLSVMHNNRGYHQEVMHIQRMAVRHERGVDSAKLGTTLEDPNIDYAGLARSLGVHAEGPITDPKDLGGALKRAVDVVKRGEPALVDVVSQPR
jgi:thiamine pyrophosphate-dependent acetolactate synthase large subunit-like protein